MTYKIPKSHPASLANISAASIVAGQNASYFLEAVKAYISPYSPYSPQPFDHFNLYKHLTFALPAILESSLSNRQLGGRLMQRTA
jgi:hypothetical protein